MNHRKMARVDSGGFAGKLVLGLSRRKSTIEYGKVFTVRLGARTYMDREG